MKKFILFLITACCVAVACDDDATYGDMRKAENKTIAAFIEKGITIYAEDSTTVMLHVDPITEISEATFYANDSTTDVSKNEYVLFAGSGVYMQIVRKGSGEKMRDGENAKVICRYHEYNLTTDSLQSSNRVVAYEQMPDVMSVTNTSGSYTGTFTQGLMYMNYGTAVPGGWLMPLPFINLGRQSGEDDEIAKVRLIVPSSEGTSSASQGIYACFYEITMQRGR